MMTIDGNQGEGGGQVLRTVLSLSAMTGRPFRMINIRGKRSKPGLRPQHLTAVRAISAICKAEIDGDQLDSSILEFQPGRKPLAGEYMFDVASASTSGHSAGSAILVMQALIWPLLMAKEPSIVTIRGGTFVPFSPPFHYFSEVVLRNYAKFGIKIEIEQKSWGWMNAGGGEVVARIEPLSNLRGVNFEAVADRNVSGLAVVTNLPSHIPHRMARRAHNLLEVSGLSPSIQERRERGKGPGAGIVLWLEQGGFSALGRKGLPAERVAEETVGELLTFLDNGAAVDYHLADQLLIPMALASGKSKYSVDRLSNHTMTCIQLLKSWLDVEISIQGRLDQAGTVSVHGTGLAG